jgi:hypothetical protein
MYTTTRDILIPAGTEVTLELPHERKYHADMASIVQGYTADNFLEVLMDIEEGIASGLIKAEEEDDGEEAQHQEGDQEAGPAA